MEQNSEYYPWIAGIHGIIGFLIFATGILQLTLKKRGKLHRFTGYVYLLLWPGILLTGAFVGSMMVVGIVLLGFYLALTGVRSAMLRGKPWTVFDKTITGIALGFVFYLLVFSISATIQKQFVPAALSGFFAALYAFIIGRDAITFWFKKRPIQPDYGKMNWYAGHVIRMQFSFVTAIGAFTAVQDVFGYPLLNFTLPAILSFFIVPRSTAYFLKQAGVKPVAD